MMTPDDREHALDQMQQASHQFYRAAVHIQNHPFIEFAGLMNEYINACKAAHAQGIDFTECNRHSGQTLPLHPVMSDYIKSWNASSLDPRSSTQQQRHPMTTTVLRCRHSAGPPDRVRGRRGSGARLPLLDLACKGN